MCHIVQSNLIRMLHAAENSVVSLISLDADRTGSHALRQTPNPF